MSQPNQPQKPNALGRGLDHLIGPKVGPSTLSGGGDTVSQGPYTPPRDGSQGPGLTAVPTGGTSSGSVQPQGSGRTLRVTALRPGKGQPRRHFDAYAHKELVESIKQKGVLQPILVRPVAGSQGSYEIITGERRWRASQEAGLAEIPVVIREMGDEEALEIGLIENIQREDLNPIEEAMGYKRLLDHFGYNHEKLATVVSKSRSHITNMMRLLTLPAAIQQLVLTGELSAGHARAMINCPFAADVAARVMAQNLSVRETEALVRDFEDGKFRDKGEPPIQTTLVDALNEASVDQKLLEEQLTTLLECPVKLRVGAKGGELVLKFRSMNQLDQIIATILGKED